MGGGKVLGVVEGGVGGWCCHWGKVRALPGVRAAPPTNRASGSVQSRSEGCEGAEQTLGLM